MEDNSSLMTSNKKNNFDECLHNWMFHFNPYTKLWNAFPREDYAKYFNDNNDPEAIIIKSDDIKALLRVLHSIQCNPDRIAEL